jgi:hypothetical protein
MENQKLFELSDLLKELKDKKYGLEDELKSLNAEAESVQAEMIEIMLQEELANFNRDGVTFSLTTTEYPGPAEGRKDELYDKLKEQGYEGLFSVNSQTLRGLVGDLKADNDGAIPEWLEGLIQPNDKTVIRVTKSRKLKA